MRPRDGNAAASIAIATLSEHELGRAAVRDKCDSLLRRLAAEMTAPGSRSWEIARENNKAPRLHASGQPSELHASVSHSGRWVAAAVATGSTVGIDVEAHVPRQRRREITNFLGLDKMAGHDDDRFFANWTLREAIAKATDGSVLEAHPAEALLGAACEKLHSAVSAGSLTALVERLPDAHLAVVLHETTELA